jgi:polysaccharide biosynthesis/export protein VpsN
VNGLSRLIFYRSVRLPLRSVRDRLARAFCLMALLCFGASASLLAQEAGANTSKSSVYLLGAGDQVSIQVFGEAELSIQTRIAANGRLTYPFLGDIEVVGLTSRQLEQKIVAGLKGDFLVDPKVSVTITDYRPFFVNGQVKNPGSFPYQPGLTVRKALSLAGGMTERASEKRLSVISENDKLKGRSKGRSVRLEDMVGPGDIITVDESFF